MVPMLISGVVLWSIVHLLPALAPAMRQSCMSRLGEKPYKGLFALAIVASLVLIVVGWRSTVPETVYSPPGGGRTAALGLMLVAVYLFGASHRPAAIKRVIRHPQLTGLIAWSVAHLLANGDQRSLTLFGGLGIWASVEILAINRRTGAWIKPESPALRRELLAIVITFVVYAVLFRAHPWFAGVALTGR